LPCNGFDDSLSHSEPTVAGKPYVATDSEHLQESNSDNTAASRPI